MLAALALPQYGLSTVFVVALVSATLLPMGSEPAVFGLVKLNASLFWPAVLVATAGNTVGGAITWWMGYGPSARTTVRNHARRNIRARCAGSTFGAKAACCRVAHRGDPVRDRRWLRLPFGPRAVHGHRQVRALRDDDRRRCCGSSPRRSSSARPGRRQWRRGARDLSRRCVRRTDTADRCSRRVTDARWHQRVHQRFVLLVHGVPIALT